MEGLAGGFTVRDAAGGLKKKTRRRKRVLLLEKKTGGELDEPFIDNFIIHPHVLSYLISLPEVLFCQILESQ